MAIKILFLAANPLHTEQLRLDEEVRAIDAALNQASFGDRFDLISHWAVRLDDLQALLLRHRPDIVHFSGHGSESSEIILQNAQGEPVIVPADALRDLFQLFKASIRCVVLNACYSERQGAAIAQHIDCVIGMTGAVGDAAAMGFAGSFYQALGYGQGVQEAYDLGLNQIGLTGQEDQFKSRLFTSGAEVNFVAQAARTEAEAAAEIEAARKPDIVSGVQVGQVGSVGGDMIIANAESGGTSTVNKVGDNARNVIQIGSLSVPSWLLMLIVAAMVVGIGLIGYMTFQGIQAGKTQEEIGAGQAQLQILLTPTATPIPTATPMPTPTPSMSGSFNVFVAQFGQLDADGTVSDSEFGRSVSLSVFDTLNRVYTGLDPDALPRLQIWHDSLGFSTVGAIQGTTVQERQADAAAKARSIGADMIIYGNLAQENGEEVLILDFHFESKGLWTAPDVVAGNYLLGRAIPIPIAYASDPFQAKLLVEEPVQVRSQALFWMTVGLSYSITDQAEKAYEIFRTVEDEVTEWQDGDGKEILYYLWGREAKTLRRYDEALALFERAKTINPDFVNAYVGLGQVYFDRAQVFFARGQTLPDSLAKCRVAQNIDLGAATLDNALADISLSMQQYEEAMRRTDNTTAPTITAMIQQATGLSLRLQGQAQITIAYQNQVAGDPFAADLASGERFFTSAKAVLTNTLPVFAQGEQYTLLALSHWALGNSDRMLAHVRLVEAGTAASLDQADVAAAKHQDALALLDSAVAEYQTCVDQRVKLPTDLLLKSQIIDCACTPSSAEAQAVLAQERAK